MSPRWLGVVMALIAVLAGPPVASAASGSVVGIHPAAADESWIVLDLAPGGTAAAAAVLENLTGRRQVVELGTADATTTEDGVFTLAGAGEAPAGVGAWIAGPRGRLTLAPHESRTIRFRVRVPRDAPPGDHSGGLVVQSASAASASGGEGVAVRVVERVGLRVYVRVAGRRDETLVVEDLAARVTGGASGVREALGLPDGVDVSFAVRHAGNVRFERLAGVVELRRGGEVAARRPLDLGTLLPGGRRAVSAHLPLPAWSPGGWEVAVRLGDDAAAPLGRAEVGVSPLRPLATGGLLLAVVGTGIWSRGRRAR